MDAMPAIAVTPPVDVLRPDPPGFAARLTRWGLTHAGFFMAILRRVRPILKLGDTYVLTRHDDVREAFLADAELMVPYKPQLDVIMGGTPFFLGMANTPAYRADIAAMRAIVRADDLPGLAAAANAQAGAIVGGAGGRLEVVDALTRDVTFGVLAPYFGIAPPAEGDLRLWTTRLFDFQFVDSSLLADATAMSALLRAHVERLMAARRGAANAPDDILGRALDKQAQGLPGYADTQIRNALIGFMVGGVPQPPMVAPQMIEQLLRRPEALAGAQAAARANDMDTLRAYLWEALRFDPLAPALQRVAVADRVIAAGTPRATKIPAGAKVMVGFASAMMDPRRVRDPARFDPTRLPHTYMLFGHGLHECFGKHINAAIIPAMLAPLLRQPNLRRAAGPLGHLTKRGGVFADRLWVEYG